MDVHFEWDPDKDFENLAKHGVSFIDAQAAAPMTVSVDASAM